MTEQIFLCSYIDDTPIVTKLYQRLQADGFNIWWSEEDLLPGHDPQFIVSQAVRQSRAILICLSPTAQLNTGDFWQIFNWALDEAKKQPDGSIFIIPIRLYNSELPQRLSNIAPLDYFGDPTSQERQYQKLLKALNLKMSPHATPKPTTPVTPSQQRPVVPPAQTNINTGGGAYIAGNINNSGGVTVFGGQVGSINYANNSPAQPVPANLDFAKLTKLAELLLACPSLSNPSSRANVVNQLPAQIRQSINYSPQATARQELLNIIQTCHNFPAGFPALLDIIRFYDNGTIAFQALERFLNGG